MSNINEKRLSKDNRVKIKILRNGTTETILELDKNNPDTLVVHAWKNDLTKERNGLNNVKKFIKSVKRFLHKQN